jgi:hypothetical protein
MDLSGGLRYPRNLDPELRPFRRVELRHALQIRSEIPQRCRQIISDAAKALNRIRTEKNADLIPVWEDLNFHASV